MAGQSAINFPGLVEATGQISGPDLCPLIAFSFLEYIDHDAFHYRRPKLYLLTHTETTNSV